jgi:hypothetical protein
MKRDNRSAAAPVFILEMFSVMLLSALLVGMMISESMGKSALIPADLLGPVGCGRPNDGCNMGCARTSSSVQGQECAGGCASDAQCKKCSCRLKPKDPSKQECWCQ